MPIPQRALNLGLSAMRQLKSAWGRLTKLRKAINVLIMLVLPCTMLLLLIWGVSRLFGSKWNEKTRVALALAVVVGFFLFCDFMLMPKRDAQRARVFRHAELNAEMQEVRIERNKVRIGMTINDVLPLVHGMDIDSRADGAWLSVLPDNKRFYYSPDGLSLLQHDDGTYTFRCYCGTELVSPNSRVTESQAVELFNNMGRKPEQVLKNLTEAQAAALMKKKMSDGFDWSWQYTTVKRSRGYDFTVTFGPDGRVNHISDVSYTDLQNHRV